MLPAPLRRIATLLFEDGVLRVRHDGRQLNGLSEGPSPARRLS